MFEENKIFKKIRIFVASPKDVSEERKCLKNVVDRLNQTGSIADKYGLVLEVLDWNSHVRSAMGNPEGVILKKLPVEKWDLFIGILWLRFGTESNNKTSSTGIGFETGTEEEFYAAYNSWKKEKRPSISFYRCHRNFDPISVDTEQLKRVNIFFENFAHNGKFPGLYKTFEETSDFERIVMQDLISFIQEYIDDASAMKSQKNHHYNEKQLKKQVTSKIETCPEKIKNLSLQEGNIYNVALLDIDIAGHSKLLKKFGDQKIESVIENFHSFLIEMVKSHNGEQFCWAGDGGIFIFWENDCSNDCVLCGIRILNELEAFNLDIKQNPIEENVRVRLAANYGSLEYKEVYQKIHADCINLVSHLQGKGTNPDCFNITEEIYNRLCDKLQETFKYIKKFEEHSIYMFRSQRTSSSRLTEDTLNNFQSKIKFDFFNLNEKLMKILGNDKDHSVDIDLVQKYIEGLYVTLNEFYYQYFDFNERWQPEYLKKIVECLNLVISDENSIYTHIQTIHNRIKSTYNTPNFSGLMHNTGVLRANSIPNFKKLVKQFETLINESPKAIDTTDEDLYEKISDLIESDEFNEENALVELLLNSKEKLIDYINKESHDPMHEKLLQRLWKLSDFVLLDDIVPSRNIIQNQNRLLFPALSEINGKGKLFKSVIEVSIKFETYSKESIQEYLSKSRIEYCDLDITIMLRCLLISVPDRKARISAIQSIDFNDLWRLISYTITPFRVIREITEHLYHIKNNDLMKIFFDLTLPRIIHEINTFSNNIVLHQIKIILVVFYSYDCFVETRYFERLEDLRLRFVSEAQKISGIKISIINEFWDHLKKKRKERGNPLGTIPNGINKLPLPIQRHLAREGHYIDFFVTHQNHLIALEVRKYININNIERLVLKLNRININLLRNILDKNELFKKKSLVEFVLNSPKCNLRFALKHVFKMSKSELIKIARNPNANTDVKNHVKVLVKNKFGLTIKQ